MIKFPKLKKQNEQGATLIEVLISILIISVGMLGIAGSQTQGLSNTQSAMHRSYASQLIYEVGDLMRTTRGHAITSGGVFDNVNTATLPAAIIVNTNCYSESGTACGGNQAMATSELAVWAQKVQDLLPNGQATIVRGTGDLFTISINWADLRADKTRFEANLAGGATVDNSTMLSNVFSTSFQL